MSVAKEALHSLVEALRALLETAAPQAEAFLRDWPQEWIARPVGARSLPVVAALQGLSRLAAPETRALVEAVEALARDLDWRQTYTSADFGARFLESYAYNEWVGQRGAFISESVACGVLCSCSGLRPNIPTMRMRRRNSISRSPVAPSGVRMSPAGGFVRRGHGSTIPRGPVTPCALHRNPCSRPMSGAPAIFRRNRASGGDPRRPAEARCRLPRRLHRA